MKRQYHEDFALPTADDYILVFGSNLAGRHGAGAAKIAYSKFGARYGVGVGMTGKSYAVPTKNQWLQTLSLDTIQLYVKTFVHLSTVTDYRWWVTRLGCGLAGYQDKDIAPMFKLAQRCSFPIEWKPFV